MTTMGRPKTATRKRRPGRRTAPARQSLSREDWIAAARAELIAAGINAVKVGLLARRLRVTRGSFYWHFTSHADLLRELLQTWEQTNTDPFERVLRDDGPPQGLNEFVAIVKLWVEEKDYSPAFDTAVRDWARTSRAAAAAVHRADERRIAILHRVFSDMGFVDPEALIRARIAYFHQVGYYTLKLQEDRERRLALVPLYCQVLLGRPVELIDAAFGPAEAAPAGTGAPAAAPVANASRRPLAPIQR